MIRVRVFCLALAAVMAASASALAQQSGTQQSGTEPYKPTVGMAGRDAVWVPTSEALVEKMFEVAQLTTDDFVMDLGSGDGRMIIAAAKRGARGRGVEYNPDLVEFSKKLAVEEGVADKAEFVQGDMYVADISQATVLALFLLPENLRKLTPAFLDLRPGSRIVVNTFGIPDWEPDVVERIEEGCESWCEAKLYIVPAKAAGTWQLPKGSLVLEQTFQHVSGTLNAGGSPAAIESGKLTGTEISFTAGGTRYAGRVNGDTMELTGAGGERVTARRQPGN
jgi:SAM-dependent methyltransferase